MKNKLISLLPNLLLPAFFIAGLYLTSLYSYLLFHSLVEIFSVLIAGAIFILAWNFRRFFDGGFFIFLGTAYLSFGFLDLIHTLAYKGMGIFQGYDANLPTQLWIAARYLQALSLLLTPFFLRRTVKFSWLAAGFGGAISLVLLSIFVWKIFPVCYIEGTGLTPFKIISEYVINLILATSVILLWRKRCLLDKRVLRLLILSILFTMGGELAFTFYIDVYGLSNLVGHFFKVIAFYLIYKSIIGTAATSIYTNFTQLQETEKALRESEAQLRARTAELEAIMDAVPAYLWITHDPQGMTMTGNRATYELSGKNQGENLSLSAGNGAAAAVYRAMRNGNQIPPEKLPVQQAAASGKHVHDYEFDLVFDDESRIHLLGNATPLLDKEGKPAGAVGAFIDVTAREQAEEAMIRYSEELERSNEALKDFAFIASHDLREPLRKIQAFGSRLQEKHSQALDGQAHDYITRMVQAAWRMQSMLDGLLDYSRVTTQSKPFTKVDLNQAARDVLNDLEVRILQTGGRVEIGELAEIDGDPQQIRLLLQNLLGNALKFHRPGTPPTVTVCSRPGPKDTIELVIEDNGIGFDMGDVSQLFQPFRRLHRRDEYEGSGMGLAICKKIVERHKGKISVQSAPDRGTVFIVSLPVRQDL